MNSAQLHSFYIPRVTFLLRVYVIVMLPLNIINLQSTRGTLTLADTVQMQMSVLVIYM